MRADTKTVARIIETEAGRLVGRVDRARRGVVWGLACPDCSTEIPMTETEFRGRAPLRCPECSWTSPVCDANASGDASRWYDFALVFETVPPSIAKASAA